MPLGAANVLKNGAAFYLFGISFFLKHSIKELALMSDEHKK